MAVRVSSELKVLLSRKEEGEKKIELEVVWGKNLLVPSVGIVNLGFYLVFCMLVLLVVDTGIFLCINTDVGSMLHFFFFCFCWIIITCFELFFYSCCIFLAVRAMLPLISYDMLSDTFCYKLCGCLLGCTCCLSLAQFA